MHIRNRIPFTCKFGNCTQLCHCLNHFIHLLTSRIPLSTIISTINSIIPLAFDIQHRFGAHAFNYIQFCLNKWNKTSFRCVTENQNRERFLFAHILRTHTQKRNCWGFFFSCCDKHQMERSQKAVLKMKSKGGKKKLFAAYEYLKRRWVFYFVAVCGRGRGRCHGVLMIVSSLSFKQIWLPNF